MPERIQLSRRKGWRMPPNTVKVDRSTKWGNPFVRHLDGHKMDPEMAVQSFRGLLRKSGAWWPIPMPWPKGKVPAADPTTVADVRSELRGKNLACWCHLDQPCHADVLLEIAKSGGSGMTECDWQEDENGNYETSCDMMFQMDEGTPEENHMRFCCYCGKNLIGKPFVYPDTVSEDDE